MVGDVAGLLSELLEEEDLGGAPLELCHILPSRPSSLGYQVPGCLGAVMILSARNSVMPRLLKGKAAGIP